MTIIVFVISFLFFAAAVTLVIYNHLKNRRLLNSLEKMLKEAMEGTFTGSHYDESLLSKLESELSDFLSSSSLSAQNVKAEKDKLKELISDISHQTKTPIANILLYAQLLDEQEFSEDAKPLISSLIGQSEKLKTLIDALVKTSRLETGIYQFQTKRAKVEPMLEETIRQYLPKAQRKGRR